MRQASGAAPTGMRRGTRFLLKALIVLAMLSVLLVPPELYLRRVASQMSFSASSHRNVDSSMRS